MTKTIQKENKDDLKPEDIKFLTKLFYGFVGVAAYWFLFG